MRTDNAQEKTCHNEEYAEDRIATSPLALLESRKTRAADKTRNPGCAAESRTGQKSK